MLHATIERKNIWQLLYFTSLNRSTVSGALVTPSLHVLLSTHTCQQHGLEAHWSLLRFFVGDVRVFQIEEQCGGLSFGFFTTAAATKQFNF